MDDKKTLKLSEFYVFKEIRSLKSSKSVILQAEKMETLKRTKAKRKEAVELTSSSIKLKKFKSKYEPRGERLVTEKKTRV